MTDSHLRPACHCVKLAGSRITVLVQWSGGVEEGRGAETVAPLLHARPVPVHLYHPPENERRLQQLPLVRLEGRAAGA